MANIREESAPAGLGLNPSETGIEAVAGEARRVGMFYNQTADLKGQEGGELSGAIKDAGQVATNYVTHRDLTIGGPAGTQMASGLDSAWNEANKPKTDASGNLIPPDPTTRAKFMEEQVEPAIEQFKSGFSTEESQKWAEQFTNNLRTHLSNKSAADLATNAGTFAVQSVTKTTNNLASMVYADPSSLDFAITQYRHAIGGSIDSSPMIDSTQAASIKASLKGEEAIVKSAVGGMIAKNPNIDLTAIQKKYGDYLVPGEMQTFQKQAQAQEKSNTLTDKQIQVAQRQLDELNVHKDATKTLTDNVSFDPTTGRPIVDPKFFSQALDIAKKNPNAPNAASTVQTMFNWGESQQSKSDHLTDPSVASALDSRMWVPENPTTKLDIMKAEADKKISRPDAQIRMNLIDQRDKMPTDPQFKFAMDGAKQLIDGRTPGERSMQAGKYATFMQQLLGEYQRQKAAGTLAPDALSLSNPDSLISKTMQPYKSPLAAAVSSNGGVGAPPPPPPAAAAAEPKGPQPGDIRPGSNGSFKFKGGDPRKKENWEPVS